MESAAAQETSLPSIRPRSLLSEACSSEPLRRSWHRVSAAQVDLSAAKIGCKQGGWCTQGGWRSSVSSARRIRGQQALRGSQRLSGPCVLGAQVEAASLTLITDELADERHVHSAISLLGNLQAGSQVSPAGGRLYTPCKKEKQPDINNRDHTSSVQVITGRNDQPHDRAGGLDPEAILDEFDSANLIMFWKATT